MRPAGHSAFRLRPQLFKPLDAHRLGRAQLLREQGDAQFFEQPAEVVELRVGGAAALGQTAPESGFQRAQLGQTPGIADRIGAQLVQAHLHGFQITRQMRQLCPRCLGDEALGHQPRQLRMDVVGDILRRTCVLELAQRGGVLGEHLGRGRLMLIANEVGRAAAEVLAEHAAALRKLKDARAPKDVADDVQAQLARLVPKRFVAETPWAQLAHLPRYLKAVQMRLDKLRADPGRDAQRMAELRPLEAAFRRRLAERRGTADARLDDFRWLLEELRVGLFAQELRTPQPVSVKRLEKLWAQLQQ